jgi:head-tail adaptor
MYGFAQRKQTQTRRKKWVGPELRYQLQVREPSQTEESSGGLDLDFTTLKTIWAGIRRVSPNKYVRYTSTEDIGSISHEIVVRRNAVDDLHTSFTKGFSSGFDSVADLMPLKSTMFFFLEQGSTVRGRLFRIVRTMDIDERRETLLALCEEIEERGTGNPG